MNVLFLSHYFPPEGNAPAARVYELCRRWAAAGHSVRVVTGVPNVPNGIVYEGYRNRLVQHETMEGIEITRVWTYVAPNRGTARRILNYLSYAVSACIAGLGGPRPDVIVATSPQFFCGWAGVVLSRWRRRAFVLEVRDIWPESIVSVGAMRKGPVTRLLERMERAMYAAARRIVTVGDGYREALIARGVPAEKITVITHGVDREFFHPREPDGALRASLGLGRSFVCSYVGTIGMACGLEVVLSAAELLRTKGRDDIRFLLVGDGATRSDLEAKARDTGLGNVLFAGLQPRRAVPAFLSITDASLVHLADRELFQTVFPSKLLESLAMARPVILGVRGYAARLLREANAGICIEPGNAGDLAAAVERLADDRRLGAAYGQAGLDYVSKHFDLDERAAKYVTVLESASRT